MHVVMHDPKRFGHSFQTWSGLRPGSRVLTELIFFKKNQNDVVLVKKNKNQRVATGFLIGSCQVVKSLRVFPSTIFSSTRPGSSPGSAGSRVDPPGQTGFQNYGFELCLIFKNFTYVFNFYGVS
jgi:hypothetical protein